MWSDANYITINSNIQSAIIEKNKQGNKDIKLLLRLKNITHYKMLWDKPKNFVTDNKSKKRYASCGHGLYWKKGEREGGICSTIWVSNYGSLIIFHYDKVSF